MTKFKIGDKVRIKPNTRFSFQSKLNGEIWNINKYSNYKYNVKFSDGDDGFNYADIDLELVEKKPFKFEDMIL